MIVTHMVMINLWVGNSYYEGRMHYSGKHCMCPPMTKLIYTSSFGISYICQNVLVVDVIGCTSNYCIDMPLLQ